MEMNIFKNLHQEKMMELSEATSDMEKARINGYLDAVDDLENYFRKHRWHDLKKDIEDIPKYSHDVLLCVNNGTKKAYFVMYYDSRRNEFIFQTRVWKFIPEEWIELKWKELEP